MALGRARPAAGDDTGGRDAVAAAATARGVWAPRVELKGIAGKRRIFRVPWAEGEDAPRPRETAETAPVEGSVFRREGDYWTVTHEGRSFRLRDAKGLRYLAQCTTRARASALSTTSRSASRPGTSATTRPTPGRRSLGTGEIPANVDSQWSTLTRALRPKDCQSRTAMFHPTGVYDLSAVAR